MASKTFANVYSVVRDGNTNTWDVVQTTHSSGSYVISDFPQAGDNLTVLGDISGDDVYLDTITKSGFGVTGVYMGETADGQSFVGENNDQYYLYTNGSYSQGEAFDTTPTEFSVCFAAGTLITTPNGAVAIETIKIGDRVLTAGGENRAVKWVGHRSLDLRAEVNPETSWPVRIA
ncbi:MAG TPA: Hint domain-containing protein, partial [Steroidobacteraceae bacterium]